MGTEILLRLERIDTRIIYAILLILLAIPLFRPIGLPIYFHPLVVKHYEVIDSLQPGDRVFIWASQPPGIWPDVVDGAYAMLQHIFLKPGVIVITAGGAAFAPPLNRALIAAVLNNNPTLNKTQGVDYVELPFIPGGEAALAAIARDFRAAVITGKKDFRGISLETLPAMDGINTLADFKVCIDWTNAPEQMVRQFYVKYPTPETGVHYLHHVTIAFILKGLPFLGVGFTSVTGGMTQGVMYQALLNRRYGAPYYAGAIAQVDGFVGFHVFAIVLIVLGNLKIISDKIKKQGVKK